MAIKITELVNFACSNKDDSILAAVLKMLKNYPNLEEIEADCYSQLESMISLVNENSTKALLIETIAEFPNFISDNKTLEEYVKLISQGTTSVKEAVRCLGAFAVSGSSMHEIFVRLAENLNKNLAIQILVSLGTNEWGDIPSHLESFAQEVKVAQRIRYRSGVISAFLLIVQPLCSEYAYISCISFGYPSAEAAVTDWAWVTPESTDYILERKIVTPREAKILLKLGNLLHSNVSLNSEEITKLYTEFFESKNPIDVIFTLPN